MLDSPDHGCPVLLIERIARVNDEKPQILLLPVLLLEDAHRVDGALYPSLQAPRQLRGAAGGLGLRPGDLQQALCYETAPSLSHFDRSDPRLLIQRNQPAACQCPVGGPWGPPIAEPLYKVADNPPEFCTCGAEPEESVLKRH